MTMTQPEIDRLRLTARRAGRIESVLMEIADREEAALQTGIAAKNERLMAEVIDLAYAVVVAMPSPVRAPKRPRASPCVACLTADAGLDEEEGAH